MTRGSPAGASAWRSAWTRTAFRWDLLLTLVLFVTATAIQGRFVAWNEGRSGVVLPDPLLALFEPRDFSTLTFALIYAGLLFGLGSLARHPRHLLRALQAYAYLALLRVGLMYLAPLDPPASIIPLRDPLVEVVSAGAPLTRDLFFSGHTATLFLLHLALPAGRLKWFLLGAAAAVGVLTVWQHSHYAIDVLVAPFLAFGCLRLAGLGRRSLGSQPHEPV